MKHVLGIIASPRRLGNCEIMVKEISRALPCDHRLQLLRLSDFELRPCRGCYVCLADAGRCPLEDDLYAVLEPIAAADGLIVAAPAYFLSANSGLKRLLDRGLAFYARIDALWSKPAVGVAVAGIEGKEGYTLLGVENFLKCLWTANKGCRVVYGALPGEALLEPRNGATALALATALFAPSSAERVVPACPLCGGETFRFLSDGAVRCMLCSNTGTVAWGDGRPVFDIRPGAHDFLLSKTAAVAHREWLLGMKARFSQQKKKLKATTLPYLKTGHWVLPPEEVE